MSYISKLDEETEEQLNQVYDSLYKKWRKGLTEKKPSKLAIIRGLIKDLHAVLVAKGDIKE